MKIIRVMALGCALSAIVLGTASAAGTLKVGVVLSMTGPFALAGHEMRAGIETYLAMHGDKVAGKNVEIIYRDDTGQADVTKRLSQELVIRDHVNVLTGFDLTPLAGAAAPIATEAKIPMVLMSTAGLELPKRSPYIVRVFQTLYQPSYGMARWAAEKKIKRVVTLVSDYAPGIDAEVAFKKYFTRSGGTVPLSLRVPLSNQDFTPFLQRAKDARPNAIFVFAPPGPADNLMRQFKSLGLTKAGIQFIGAGDFVPEAVVSKGDARFAFGVISAQTYDPLLKNPANQAFSKAYEKISGGITPDVQPVSAYDGMLVIYRALEATKGNTDGTALLDAMKGMKWNSPRGPVSINPRTRDITQNVYVRQFQLVNGKVAEVPIATYEAVPPDPK
ncbi:MAG: ABC transporter substrate-binding protein [Stellaceae bacterium]